MSHIILQATIDDIVNVGLDKLLYSPIEDVSGKYATIERNAPESYIVTFKNNNKILVDVFRTLEDALSYIREYIRQNAGLLINIPF